MDHWTYTHNNITFRVGNYIEINKDTNNELPILNKAIGEIISIDDLGANIEIIWALDDLNQYVPPSLSDIHLTLFHGMMGHSVSKLSNPNTLQSFSTST